MANLQAELDEFEVFAKEHLGLKFDELDSFKRKKMGRYFDERDNYFAVWVTTKRFYEKGNSDDSHIS